MKGGKGKKKSLIGTPINRKRKKGEKGGEGWGVVIWLPWINMPPVPGREKGKRRDKTTSRRKKERGGGGGGIKNVAPGALKKKKIHNNKKGGKCGSTAENGSQVIFTGL